MLCLSECEPMQGRALRVLLHRHSPMQDHAANACLEAPAGLQHQGEAKVGCRGMRVGGAGHAAEVGHRDARRRKVLLLQQLVLRARRMD